MVIKKVRGKWVVVAKAIVFEEDKSKVGIKCGIMYNRPLSWGVVELARAIVFAAVPSSYRSGISTSGNPDIDNVPMGWKNNWFLMPDMVGRIIWQKEIVFDGAELVPKPEKGYRLLPKGRTRPATLKELDHALEANCFTEIKRGFKMEFLDYTIYRMY